MTPTFLAISITYAVAACVLFAVVVGCFWDGWRG